VIVVHPDEISILDVLNDCPRKQPIGLLIGVPGGLVEGDFTGVVMEEGPED
jgi:hypothetical protein